MFGSDDTLQIQIKWFENPFHRENTDIFWKSGWNQGSKERSLVRSESLSERMGTKTVENVSIDRETRTNSLEKRVGKRFDFDPEGLF